MSYAKLRNMNVLVRRNQEQNKDVLAGVTGFRGDGKSNFVMVAAYNYVLNFGLECTSCGYEWIYQGKSVRPDKDNNSILQTELTESCPKCNSKIVNRATTFNFEKYMAYDNRELTTKIKDREILPDYSPLIGDEAVEWAYSLDFAKTENKDTKKLITKHRPRKLVQFVNLPNFKRLDSNIREMLIYHIWIMQRTDRYAIAILFIIDKGNKDDPWHLKQLDKLTGHYNELTPMDKIIQICDKIVAKHPCALDWFRIPPLPEKIYQDYEVWRNLKVFGQDDEAEEIDQKELGKIIAYNIQTNWNLLLGEIKRSRFKKPTVRVLEKYLFSHPKTGEPLARYTTIRNWTKAVERIIKHDRQP